MYGKIRTQGSLIETKEEKTYRIQEIISEGELSRIIKAEERIGEDSQVVLLKEYLAEKYEEAGFSAEEAAEREFRQCRIIAESGFSGALTINYRVHELETGTVLGVMTEVRKGKTLQNFVQSAEWSHMVLRDRLRLGYELFKLLANFHEETKMIHGDLSPSNIYLYNSGMDYGTDKAFALALLDFGCSVCAENEEENAETFIGGTEGYVHPELEAGIRGNLTKEDDWYSARQVFWHLFTGNSPIAYPVTAENLKRVYDKIAINYEADYLTNAELEGVIENCREGYYELVLDSLSEIFLGQQEYSADIIVYIKKIIDVIKNVGVSRERLCVLLKEAYTQMHRQRFANQDIIRRILPHVGFEAKKGRARFVDSGSMRPVQLKEFMQTSQNSLLMIGDGGVGKTTSLIDILDQFYEKNTTHLRNPLVFMELCILSQNYEDWYSEEMEGTFIEQFIASYFLGDEGKFADKNHPYVRALREDMFRQPEGGRKAYTILLDGLNEVGFANINSRRRFLDSLNHYLLYAKNVRLVITGRNDVPELSEDYLKRLKTVGLDDSNISDMLLEAVNENRLSRAEFDRLIQKKADVSSREYRLWNCLKIPFFLIMYCFVSERQGITRQGEILKRFFHDKRETLDDTIAYGEKVQSQAKYRKKSYGSGAKLRMDLSIRVLLDFIVPEIAIEMVSTNHFYVTWERLGGFLEETLNTLKSEKNARWMKTYYGYEVDVREIFARIYEIDRGKQIAGYACDVLGIMRMTADRALFFTHQYFRDYFAACAVKNRMLHALEYQEENELRLDGEEFRAMVYPLHDKELSVYLCSFIGEMLGEHHNMPYFDSAKREWRMPPAEDDEQELLGRFLNIYRYLGEKGEDARSIYVCTGLKNIIEILKHSRVQNTGKTDFAGLSLNGLVLQGISLYGVNFSHYNPGESENLRATFTDTCLVREALERNGEQDRSVCCSIHPSERKILLLNQRTEGISELNLDTGERRTLGESIDSLGYAEYISEKGDILLLSSKLKIFEEKGRQLIIRRKGERTRQIRLIELRCYRHSCEKVFSLFQTVGEILKVMRLDSEGRFGICLKNESAEEVSLLIVNLNDEHMRRIEEGGSDPEEIVTEARYVLPDTPSFLYASDRTFWFSHAGGAEFLIGDVRQCPGSVGIWNVADGTLGTALYMQEPDASVSIEAVAKCEQNGEVYLIYRNESKSAERRERAPAILAQYKPEDFNEWENTFIQSGKLKELGLAEDSRIEMLPGQKAFIALYDRRCMKVDAKSKETLWTVNVTAISFHTRNGMMILNAEEGIYEIDLATGYAVCVHNHKVERKELMIGHTNLTDRMISFDGEQIVKWIDVNSGRAYRHTILQDTGREYEKIFGDGKQERIFAISGRIVTCWDALSGLVVDSQIIPLPRQLELSNIDFDDTGYQLLVYYNGMDYSVFPLRKFLALEKRSLYQTSGEEGNRQIETLKQQLHYVVSGKNCIVEEPSMKPALIQKKEEPLLGAFMKTLGKARESDVGDEEPWDEELWDEEFDEGALEGDDFSEGREVKWNRDVVFAGYPSKRISILREDNKKAYVDTISADDKVIGYAAGAVLSSCKRSIGSEVLRLSKKNYREAVEMKALHGSYIKEAFMVGTVAVFQQKKYFSDQYNIVFWDLKGEEVYLYEPRDYQLCTECTSEEGGGKAVKASEIKKKAVIDKAKRFALQNTYVLRKLKDRWNAVNLPALLIVLALTALSCGPFLGLEENYGAMYWERFLLYGVLFFISGSLILPRMTDYLESHITAFVFDFILLGIFVSDRLANEWGELWWLWRYRLSWTYFNRWMWIVYLGYLVMLQKDVKHGLVSPVHTFFMILVGCQFFNADYVSETILANYILLICATWFYMACTRYYKFELKKAMLLFGKILAVFSAFVSLLWMIFNHMDGVSDLVYWELEDYLFRWGPYIERSREILKNAKQVGEGTVPQINEKNWEYFQDYFINFIFGKYGIIAGVAVICLFLLLLYLLFRGAGCQRIPADRNVCLGCSFFLTIQFVVYLLPSLGLQLIPPGAAPFMESGVPYFGSSWMALCIYQIYFRAHGRR